MNGLKEKAAALVSQLKEKGVWATAVQFVKFGIVGLSNTLISLAVYYVFVWIDPGLYMWGSAAGWVVSVLNAFYWSNRVVFANESNTKKDLLLRLLKSYLSYGGTFLLSQLLLWLEVQCWGVDEWIAPIVNLLLTIPLNFLINKFWTFRK